MSLRAAQVRIYVDADMLGLGKILASLRNDVTYPGDPGAVIHMRQRPPCPVTSPDVLDTDWIPEVAGRGWLIVTRDSMITQNRNEITAVRENKAKMVALNQRDAQTKWGQLEVFMTQWRRIEALISEPGPFIWRASRTAMTSILLSKCVDHERSPDWLGSLGFGAAPALLAFAADAGALAALGGQHVGVASLGRCASAGRPAACGPARGDSGSPSCS